MKRKLYNASVGLILIALSLSSVHAALIDRGNGMIYDSAQNITWLQDAQWAVNSGYVADNLKNEGGSATDDILADGRMGWDAANDWANQLVYGGYSD